MARRGTRSSWRVAALLVAVTLCSRSCSFTSLSKVPSQRAKCSVQMLAVRVPNPPAEGEREVVDGPSGPIIVAKVDGQYYATDATCPHL
eukprot:4694364-Amphidinium_carterae.1